MVGIENLGACQVQKTERDILGREYAYAKVWKLCHCEASAGTVRVFSDTAGPGSSWPDQKETPGATEAQRETEALL